MKSVTPSSFCKNCQKFQIEHLFGVTAAKSTGNTDLIDERYHARLIPGGCGLCDFFMECLPERCKVRSADGTWRIGMNSAASADARDPARVLVWCYPPKKEEGSLGGLCMTMFSEKIIAGHQYVEVPPFVCVSIESLQTHEPRTPAPSLELSPVSDWLNKERCAEQAPWLGEKDHASLALTVIDCTTRLLVPLPKEELYATLSYVWGRAIQPPLDNTNNNRLPQHLPNTIQDSIDVSNALNIRYLWIDRYCISHNNSQLRKLQLSRMDEVYQNSFLTIVACVGENPNFGLPGISRQRKSNRCIEIVGLGYIEALSQSIDIHSGIWSTRAWTYQEALLSQRQLYFTDKEMFFGSTEGIQEERGSFHKSNLEQSLPQRARTGNFTLNTVRDSSNRRHSIGRLHVWECIHEYSTRVLSYQSDILNALLGILAYYRREHSICHLWGIPFSTSALALPPFSFLSFEMSLRWVSNGHSLRRKGFPSWSWTGCNGYVIHLDVARGIGHNKTTNKEEAIHIEIELASGRLLKWSNYQAHYANLQEYSQTQTSEKNADQLSRFIYLGALTSRIVGRHRGQVGIHYYSIDASTVVSGELELFGAVEIPSDTESNVQTEESFPVGSLLALHFPQLDSSSLLGGVYDPPRYSFWNDGCALLIRNFGDHWERVCLLGSRRGLKREEVHKVRRKIRLG